MQLHGSLHPTPFGASFDINTTMACASSVTKEALSHATGAFKMIDIVTMNTQLNFLL